MTLKVVDRFTTRDGKWEIDNRPYGLTKEAFDKYGGWDIPGKGAAAHLMLYCPDASFVEFFTTDGKNSETKTIDSTGWVNMNLWVSSHYWPPAQGPWGIKIDGIELIRGLGLPEGLHVSTWLIVKDVDLGSQPATPTVPGNAVSHIQVLVNGVVKSEFWV